VDTESEITGDPLYGNLNLTRQPFRSR